MTLSAGIIIDSTSSVEILGPMIDIPLFPLNTVLFPGMPLNLHIFEERYKLMMNTCIESRQPFGVVLILDGEEAGSALAKPHLIGCTAQIKQVQPLSEGRMNISAVGRERFQVTRLNWEKAYLMGTVELIPMPEGDKDALFRDSRFLRAWVKRYLEILGKSGQINVAEVDLPGHPSALAYLSAVLLQQMTPGKKQELLAAESKATMVAALREIYRREVTLMQVELSPPEGNHYRGIFSLN